MSANSTSKAPRGAIPSGVVATAVIVGILVLGSNFAVAVSTPAWHHDTDVGPNYEVGAGTHPDWPKREPSIAVDPRDPSILAAAFMDNRLVPLALPNWGHVWLAYYRSTDGGRSWTGGLIPGFPGDNSTAGLASPLRPYNFSADPMVQFDSAGNLYLSGAAAAAGTPGSLLNYCASGAPRDVTFVAKYSADGSTYARETIVHRGCNDFPRMAVDTSTAPTSGSIYQLCTVSYATSNGTSRLFRSTDGGLTFHLAATLQGVAGALVVTPGGAVVAQTGPTAGPQFVSVSTDGAKTFGPAVIAFVQHVGTLPLDPYASVAGTISAASDRHAIYVVYPDMPGNHSEIKLVRSTDGGLSWSSPVILNSDRDGQAFQPTVAVGPEGIGVAWYDARNGLLANGSIAGMDVYFAVSTDGGRNFSHNTRVTSVTSNPNLVTLDDANQPVSYLVFWGDYITIAAGPHGWHVIWTDNRNACATVSPIYGCVDQDIYTAAVTDGASDGGDALS